MTGKEWVKINSVSNDDIALMFATAAIAQITVPSRIRRKALQYLEAREAFEIQLALNGVYAS